MHGLNTEDKTTENFTDFKKVRAVACKTIRNAKKAPLLIHQGEKGDPARITEIIANNFECISKGEHLSRDFLNLKILEEQKIIDFAINRNEPHNDPFIINELLSSLSKCKPSAEGPDGINYEMIKRLPDGSKDFLLQLYNRIWIFNEFPDWNTAHVSTFRYPGKTGYETWILSCYSSYKLFM